MKKKVSPERCKEIRTLVKSFQKSQAETNIIGSTLELLIKKTLYEYGKPENTVIDFNTGDFIEDKPVAAKPKN